MKHKKLMWELSKCSVFNNKWPHPATVPTYMLQSTKAIRAWLSSTKETIYASVLVHAVECCV
jgi:hypothetical protein